MFVTYLFQIWLLRKILLLEGVLNQQIPLLNLFPFIQWMVLQLIVPHNKSPDLFMYIFEIIKTQVISFSPSEN